MHVKSNDFNLKNNYILLGSFSIKGTAKLQITNKFHR